ncbi:MAG: helix-turn-helix transcriptional regulator [Treponema sp.]|nr:helix-turn-helix transcriptional regulator [Treponema sp.]
MRTITNSTHKGSSHFSEKLFSNDCFCNKRALSIYINELMRKKELNGPDVYKRAGISKANWSNYISEKNNPTPENARRLLVGLKCTPEEAKVLLSYCGMNFTRGNVYDECLLYCLENHFDNMIDVSIYIENHLSMTA